MMSNMNISNFVEQQLEESLKIQQQEIDKKISIFEVAVAQEGFDCSGANLFVSENGHVRMEVPFLAENYPKAPVVILVVNKELDCPTIHPVSKWIVSEAFPLSYSRRQVSDGIIVGDNSLQKAITELLERHAERELLNGNC